MCIEFEGLIESKVIQGPIYANGDPLWSILHFFIRLVNIQHCGSATGSIFFNKSQQPCQSESDAY